MQNAETNPDEIYWDAAKVAQFLHITPGTIRKWRHLGRPLPRAAIVGRQLLFRRDEVIAWASDRFEENAR